MITTVNVAATAGEAVAANWKRKLLILQNLSDTDIYIKLDSSTDEVTVANGIKLAASSNPFVITTNGTGEQHAAVRAIHAGSGNKVLRVQEDYWV